MRAPAEKKRGRRTFVLDKRQTADHTHHTGAAADDDRNPARLAVRARRRFAHEGRRRTALQSDLAVVDECGQNARHERRRSIRNDSAMALTACFCVCCGTRLDWDRRSASAKSCNFYGWKRETSGSIASYLLDVPTRSTRNYSLPIGVRRAAAASNSSTAPVSNAETDSDPDVAMPMAVLGPAASPNVPSIASASAVCFTTVLPPCPWSRVGLRAAGATAPRRFQGDLSRSRMRMSPASRNEERV